MRTKNSIKSVISAICTSAITILIGFVSQSVFVKVLGNEYLGINGLYTNILSMLSIAELGFGSAIIANLYKPVAQENIEQIKSIMQFYKTIYRLVAIIVSILGIILLPFLNSIVGDINININLQFIFILYVVDTAISYLLTYKRSILHANQKNYIMNIVHLIYIVIMNAFQMIYLIIFKEFVGYLIIKIVCRLFENLIISIIANKKYPYITSKNIQPIGKNAKKNIYVKVKGLLFHKIAEFVVLGSDNIIISTTKTLGIAVVGLYSNYYMIIKALNNLFGQIFTSITASIGNLLVEANNKKIMQVYKSTLLLNSWLYSIVAISLFFISTPFIKVWIGDEYLLSKFTVITLAINFYIHGMRQTYISFKEAAGIYYEDRYVPILESIVNIVSSIILVNIIGLPGVFIGTIISNLVLFIYSYPKYVYKMILHGQIFNYIKENIEYAFMFAVSFFITYIVIQMVKIESNYVLILIYGIICLCIPTLVFFVIKYKTDEFNYYKNLIKNMELSLNMKFTLKK